MCFIYLYMLESFKHVNIIYIYVYCISQDIEKVCVCVACISFKNKIAFSMYSQDAIFFAQEITAWFPGLPVRMLSGSK